MNLKISILLVLSLFHIEVIFGQNFPTTQFKCYKDINYPPKTVFTKTEIAPSYKYGKDAFLNLLIQNSNLINIVLLEKQQKSYTDTAQISFIVSKDYEMHNLTITKTKNETVKNQLIKSFKESACNWVPGYMGGRLVTSWIILNVYYTVNRNQNNITLQISNELINK